MKLQHAIIVAGAALLLSACGGGGGGAETPAENPNEVPASATVSSRAYAEYAGSLGKTESGTPLDVSKVKAPTSETESPVAL